MNRSELDSCCNLLLGLRLMTVEQMDYTWSFRLAEGISIATESAWRLISEDRIRVTSEDQGHQFGLPKPVDATQRVLSTLAGCTIQAASISESTGDLVIDLEGRNRLEFLQMSCGYEAWRLYVQGNDYICTGGGGVVVIPKL